MLGVELVTDRELKTPAKDEICHAMEHMKGKRKNYFAST
jgi:alanine-glyoxylate transaminase/(R)-3-amino-2-methylpropionate-pyruvate transaminase